MALAGLRGRWGWRGGPAPLCQLLMEIGTKWHTVTMESVTRGAVLWWQGSPLRPGLSRDCWAEKMGTRRDIHLLGSFVLMSRQELMERGMLKVGKGFFFAKGMSWGVRRPWRGRSPWHRMARSARRGKASLALQRKLPGQAFRWPVNVTPQPRAPRALLAITSGPGS